MNLTVPIRFQVQDITEFVVLTGDILVDYFCRIVLQTLLKVYNLYKVQELIR